jgi:hypothetical protein
MLGMGPDVILAAISSGRVQLVLGIDQQCLPATCVESQGGDLGGEEWCFKLPKSLMNVDKTAV